MGAFWRWFLDFFCAVCYEEGERETMVSAEAAPRLAKSRV